MTSNPGAAGQIAGADAPPALMPGVEFVWAAFQALTHDRPSGLAGPVAIPFTAIDAYARRFGYGLAQFEILQRLIAALDAAYVEHMAKTTPSSQSGRRG